MTRPPAMMPPADEKNLPGWCDHPYNPSTLRRRAARTRRTPTTQLPTVRQLLEDVAAGIRVLQTRDGVAVSDDQILERARNIVAGLIGNYRISSLDARDAGAARAVRQLDLLDRLDRRFRRSS
jgi:hypothetical protein